MKYAIAIILAAGLARSAAGDVLVLKDGSRLDGDVKKGATGYVVNQGGGQYKVVPFDQVKSIELASPPIAAPDTARENLASLRRSVVYVDDLNKIIERYQRFVENNVGTPVGAEAKQDLAGWQQRRNQGLVKFGGKWIAPAERTRLQEDALKVADNARKLLKQGRLADAESLINQALQQDPQNASALYLKGLLQIRQEQWPAARKTFEQVNALAPNHAPTLNNLALVQWRQNQAAMALGTYDQAMLASPKDRQILNNVAEALYALPDEQRGSPVAQRVARRFTEQDVDLQKELAAKGEHRWGATWVTTDQLDQLKAAERQLKDRLDQLAADFDAVKVRINNIDQDSGENERAMRRLEASSYVRDLSGNIYQAVLPPTYYQLQDDQRRLQRERDDQFARLDKLREQAKAANQDLPVPKYTGIQRVIDVEGTPVVAPVPATMPATQPATAPGNRTA